MKNHLIKALFLGILASLTFVAACGNRQSSESLLNSGSQNHVAEILAQMDYAKAPILPDALHPASKLGEYPPDIEPCMVDLNQDGIINLTDITLFSTEYYMEIDPGEQRDCALVREDLWPNPLYENLPCIDFNRDSIFNLTDITKLAEYKGKDLKQAFPQIQCATDDHDGDNLSTYEEAANHTDPQNPDTDGDFCQDGYEVLLGYDPLDESKPPNGCLPQLIPAIAPSDLTAEALTDGDMSLVWDDNSINEVGFLIERSTDGGETFSYLTMVGSNNPFFRDGNTAEGVTYYYRVRSFTPNAISSPSNKAHDTTPFIFAPYYLSADACYFSEEDQQIDLYWYCDSNNATSFVIERSTDEINFLEIASVGSDITTYSDESVGSDVNYHYRVKACAGIVCSGYSGVVSETTFVYEPSDLVATVVGPDQIDLTWNDNSNAEEHVYIYRATDGVNFSYLTRLNANVTTYSDHNVVHGTEYHYKVRACANGTCSEFSNPASATL